MGLWSNHLLPRLVARGMAGEDFAEQRARALAGVRGRVLELGFGSGLNLPHYPPEVTEVLALDPVRVNRKLARRRIEEAEVPVEWVGLRGEEVPLDADSVDFVTSTWTLCTIPDPGRALDEVRRVLRPGGALVFLEHGLSPDPRVARWQRRLTPLQRRVCGGCHLDRPIDRTVQEAGFELVELETYSMKGARVATWMYRGRAAPG